MKGSRIKCHWRERDQGARSTLLINIPVTEGSRGMALEDRDEHELEQCQTCLQEERAYDLPEVTCKPWSIWPVEKQAASTGRGAR